MSAKEKESSWPTIKIEFTAETVILLCRKKKRLKPKENNKSAKNLCFYFESYNFI